jgi:hypothetical protein
LRRVLPLLVVVVLAAPPAAHASALGVERLLPITGDTPFPKGCGVTGEQTPSTEAEPHLAVNPNNAANIVATWQQDRFPSDGGALSNLVAATKDGGRTWHTTRLPGLSRCTGGRDERSSDPWLSIGPDGRVYQSSLTFSETPAGLVGAAGPTALSAATSTDGGISFSPQSQIVNDNLYDDREAVTADAHHAGTAYVAWVRRYGALGESGIEYFSRTSDGGRSWSPGVPIYTPPSGFLPDPTLIGVLPNGTLLNVFMLANGSPVAKESAPQTPLVPWRVMASRSTDQGRTWSVPVEIASIDNPVAPDDPGSGATVRAYPEVSVGLAPDGGAYVTWNQVLSQSAGRIYLSRSTDAGQTWSAPLTVASPGGQAFIPNLAVAGDGTVGVSWDDFRNDRRGDKELTTDVWLAHSHDRGAHWSETHVAGPFDMLTAPPTSSTQVEGRFIGDYQGLVGLPDGFAALFAQGHPQATHGPSDVFFARISAAGALEARRPRLRIAVRPRRARAGRRTRFRFRVTVAVRTRGRLRRKAVRRATVRFAGRRKRTDRRGRVSFVVRFRGRGRRRARATKRAYRSGTVRIRVVRPRR